jgi:hypothetical protein
MQQIFNYPNVYRKIAFEATTGLKKLQNDDGWRGFLNEASNKYSDNLGLLLLTSQLTSGSNYWQ